MLKPPVRPYRSEAACPGNPQYTPLVSELSGAAGTPPSANKGAGTSAPPSLGAAPQHAVLAPGGAANTSLELHLVCVSLVFIACVCCGVLLVYLQTVLKPLVFAVFLAYLLAPAVEFLTTPFSPHALLLRFTGYRPSRADEDEDEETSLVVGTYRTRCPRERRPGGLVAFPHSLAVLAVLTLTSVVIMLLVNLVVNSIASLEEKFPKYKAQALLLIRYFREIFGKNTALAKALKSLSLSMHGSPVELSAVPAAWLSRWVQELPITSALMAFASALLASMQTVAVVLLFAVFLMLGWQRPSALDGPSRNVSADDLRESAIVTPAAVPPVPTGAKSLPEKIDAQVRRYIVLKTALSALVAASVGITLGLLDVDLAFLFGLFSFFANYVPNVGAVVATLLPLPVVCLDPTMTWWGGVLAFLLPLLIHMVVGNVIEPKVFGMGLALHPVVVLFTILLWALLWGVSGMIVSVPLTAVLRIVLKEVHHPYSAVIVDILEGRWLPSRGSGGGRPRSDSSF